MWRLDFERTMTIVFLQPPRQFYAKACTTQTAGKWVLVDNRTRGRETLSFAHTDGRHRYGHGGGLFDSAVRKPTAISRGRGKSSRDARLITAKRRAAPPAVVNASPWKEKRKETTPSTALKSELISCYKIHHDRNDISLFKGASTRVCQVDICIRRPCVARVREAMEKKRSRRTLSQGRTLQQPIQTTYAPHLPRSYRTARREVFRPGIAQRSMSISTVALARWFSGSDRWYNHLGSVSKHLRSEIQSAWNCPSDGVEYRPAMIR